VIRVRKGQAPNKLTRPDFSLRFRASFIDPACGLKSQCTPSGNRRIKRWEHEGVIDAMHTRLELQPEMMRIRRQTVEHPFGTLKSWMGYTHFLTKTLPRVSTEMSLHILAYNMKRVIKLMGTAALMEAMVA
jgi:transposase